MSEESKVKKGPGFGIALGLLLVIIPVSWWMTTDVLRLNPGVAWSGGFALWGLVLFFLYKHEVGRFWVKVFGAVRKYFTIGFVVFFLAVAIAGAMGEHSIPYPTPTVLSTSLQIVDGKPYVGPPPATRSQLWEEIWKRVAPRFADVPNLEAFVDRMTDAVKTGDVARFQSVLVDLWQARLGRMDKINLIEPIGVFWLIMFITTLALVTSWIEMKLGSIFTKVAAFVLLFGSIVVWYAKVLPLSGIPYARELVGQGMLLQVLAVVAPTVLSVIGMLGGIRPQNRTVRAVWSTMVTTLTAIVSVNVFSLLIPPLLTQMVSQARGALSMQEAYVGMYLGLMASLALGGIINAVTAHVTRPREVQEVQNE
ncbi:hypothetical protein HY086_02650 [Candidatus Gottesmanbacteria bacterium]|nr:hypothetical protein [Candidatus Gottesmanbacteria bacterium]